MVIGLNGNDHGKHGRDQHGDHKEQSTFSVNESSLFDDDGDAPRKQCRCSEKNVEQDQGLNGGLTQRKAIKVSFQERDLEPPNRLQLLQ